MIHFACPSCDAAYNVPDRKAGRKFACRVCGQRVQVPLVQTAPTMDNGPEREPTRSHALGWILGGSMIVAAAGCILLLLAARPPRQEPITQADPAPSPDAEARPAGGSPDLADKALEILRTHCHRCHGENGSAEGGLNVILDRDKLVARRKLSPGSADGSRLYRRVREGDMPPPGESPRPSQADVAILRQWIDEGAPGLPSPQPRLVVSNQQLAVLVRDDSARLPERERRFARYFTLAHLLGVGASEDELETHRHALARLLNSLSWNKEVVRPTAVDPDRTVFRIDVRNYSWGDAVWKRILAAYPYGLLPPGPEADQAFEAAGGQLPWVRGDWFVAHASRPPLYHEILQLPETERRLEEQLHVDVRENVRQERVVRAGFNGSGVSRNNRLVERHPSPHGGYWRSYDFAGNVGRRNLFAHPLGPGSDARAFQADGGEIIFNLPNGLFAFLLVDRAGNRLDKAPLEIVSDPRRPDRAVENGISCMGCHSRGLIPKSDQVRDHVERNPMAFPDSEAGLVLALYPTREITQRLLDEDNHRFRLAAKQAGGPLTRTEPIQTLAAQFEKELDLTAAAAELGLPPDLLAERLSQSPPLARVLGVLQVSGGTVQRQVFDEAFGDLVRELQLGRRLP